MAMSMNEYEYFYGVNGVVLIDCIVFVRKVFQTEICVQARLQAHSYFGFPLSSVLYVPKTLQSKTSHRDALPQLINR